MADLAKTPLGDKLQASQQQNRPRSGEAKEDVIFKRIEELFASMSDQMKKVRVDGLPQKHEELAAEFGRLKRVRQETKQEWKLAIHTERTRAERYKTDKAICDQIQASENRVLEAVSALGATKKADTYEAEKVVCDLIKESENRILGVLGNDKRPADDRRSVGSSAYSVSQNSNRQKRTRDVRRPTSAGNTSDSGNEGEKNTEKSDGEEESRNEWTTAGRRRKPKVGFVLNEDKPVKGAAPAAHRRIQPRTPAVLIKVQDTYADTLRAVRNANINVDELGAKVAGMRKTLSGDLIVELASGPSAAEASGTLRDKLSAALGGTTVTCLGQMVEVEVVDLDEVTTKEEVLAALEGSLFGGESSPRESVTVTGLWGTRGGRQMATARIPASLATKLEFVRVGWLQCRVRPRRPQPLRCFRCHGFGHSSGLCRGPDLSACCRRCGGTDHKETNCTAGDDMCVACDREGLPRIPHRTGSGVCAARRAAENLAGWKAASILR